MLDNNWKKYLSELFHYVWVWFIWGSISHWFFSWERSIIMAIIWFLLFLIWELIQKQNFKNVNYSKILLVWVVYSLSIWMVNWWLQHFLDSPERSLWIVPLWFFISLLIFPVKESIKFKDVKKNLIFLSSFSLFISWSIILAYVLIPKGYYHVDDHHDEENIVHNEQKLNTLDENKVESASGKIIIDDDHLNDWHID